MFLYKGKYTSLFFDESGLEICYNDEFGDLHYTSGTYSVFNNPREIYKLALRDYKRSNVRLPFDNVLDNIKRDHGDTNLKRILMQLREEMKRIEKNNIIGIFRFQTMHYLYRFFFQKNKG